MIAHIINEGDASVGLPGDYATVEFHDDLLFDDPDDREVIRETLQDAFATIFDNVNTYVRFDDEKGGD